MAFFKWTSKSTMAFFKKKYAFSRRNNQNLQWPYSNGPPTFGDFSPTLGGLPSLWSTIMFSCSDPSVLVRPPTLRGFYILFKIAFFKWTSKSTMILFLLKYAQYQTNNLNRQWPFSNGPFTLADFSPILGGSLSLRSTITSSRSDPPFLYDLQL